MAIINLRAVYPEIYTTDYMIEVPDEVAEFIAESDRKEAAFRRRTYYHKAFYSLDRGDGIEYDALFLSVSPSEVYEQKVTMEQIHEAMTMLSDKQAKRVYAHFFLNMTEVDIARTEGVSAAAVCRSICRGLQKMEVFLKKHI